MTPAPRSTAAFVWYYHMPWVCDDAEVADLARESLGPLLHIHETLAAPVTLAISGALVERLSKVAPMLLERLSKLSRAGLVEIAGAFYYEVLPAVLTTAELARHIAADIAVKHEFLETTPTTFLPGNFSWVPSLAWLLADSGFGQIVLDGDHLRRACAVQQWRWSPEGKTEFSDLLAPSDIDRQDMRQPYRLALPRRRDLCLLFRDTEAVMAVSHGQDGAIQHPFDAARAEAALTSLDAESGVSVLADDGDRINALSVASYRALLTAYGPSRLTTIAKAANVPARRLDYLPGYSLADLYRFWLADGDSLHWLRVLDELRAAYPGDLGERILRLHDVYPLFWRNHWRCRLFWDEALSLMAQARSARP
jgi:hypothetical protein